MSISLFIDGKDMIQFASNRGYGDLCRWIDTLDSDEYLPLAHLRQHGSWDGRDELLDAIDRALAEHPPELGTVVDTARELRGLVREGEYYVVSDGMVRDDTPDV